MRRNQGFGVILVLLLGTVIGLALAGYAIITKKSDAMPAISRIVSNTVQNIQPSSSPMPFAEMTIPALRQREFNSQLGELKPVLDNANYTSYTTSYVSDGFRVNGLLTIPKGPVPRRPEGEVGWPAIVFVHGYIPPENYQTLTRYTDHVSYLARNGFVVFKIDLRGHGTSEGEAGGGYYSEDYIVDTLNAYSALQNSDFVNSGAIGLWGHSMAGNVLLRSLATKPDIPAIVIWAGAVYTYKDQQDYGIDDNSYQPPPADSERVRARQRLREIHGNFSEDSEFWRQVAPTNYLDDIKGAIQLNHSVNDNVVSIEYSRNLDSLLDKTSITHELHEYSNGGHNITGSAFTQAMQNTVNFFKSHLR